jgi:type VI secretion system protein ImpA
MPETADIIDIQALLAPIPGDQPAGMDLREELSPGALYTRLRDARSEARAAERAMEAEEGGSSNTPPQWRTIRELATEAISARSKDLEIAAWLTEALLRSDGLLGLGAGLQLMNGLVEQYWDDLFPLADEDGIATRVAPVATLNGRSGDGTLTQPLRRTALFNRPDGGSLQFWQYEQAVSLAGIVDATRRQQRIDAGVIPFETIEAEAQLVGDAGFAILARDAEAAAQAWHSLSAALDASTGSDAPPTSRVGDLLDQIRNAATKFAGSAATGATSGPAVDSAPVEPPATAPVSAAPAGNDVINSRAEALRSLVTIAAYFRRTEPLSPLAYTLEEVVRRAGMTWPQLLEEIIPDPASRAMVLSSLGIRPPPME